MIAHDALMTGRVDYEALKLVAKRRGRSVKDLLALAPPERPVLRWHPH